MTNTKTPYESDILNQANAVKAQLANPLPSALADIQLQSYDRIILTGMGSSDYALIPVERELAARGLPVWRVDAGRLMDMSELITENTLLWATSQSGMSGEIVALLESKAKPRTLLGLTNDPDSVLGKKSDILIPLHSGDEATVSSKSYLNTLIASYRVLAALTGQDDKILIDAVQQVLPTIASLVTEGEFALKLAEDLLSHDRPRLALIGLGADAANALTGALITKEASKVSAEGFIGGEFRHGPLETSGKGMLAILIGDGSEATLGNLAQDMLSNGTQVITIAPKAYAHSALLPVPAGHELCRLLCGFIYIEHLTVALARQNGMIPGHFLYGKKITVAL